jgi:excisionase family DNA binding protein
MKDWKATACVPESALEALPPMLTVAQVAELFGVTKGTVYMAAQRGSIPGIVKVGRSVRIQKAALAAWLKGESK